ncbi:MAG: Cof-type HAD-IIB family hydrolase [Lachnospiraceae bacterium]|nr:Cof-type HAD-IIB family hydrolase [Lachnospiraceae bacterium]
MREYKLIALDLDGTLLDDEKKISKKNISAVQKAIERGKTVIFNTGRCPAEIEEYLELLEGVRYVNSMSGALVFDSRNDKIIYSKPLESDMVKKLMEISLKEECMLHFMKKLSIVQRDEIPKMSNYGMQKYQKMYERVTTKWENLVEEYYQNPFPVEKLNIYFTSAESRQRTKERILEAGLEAEMMYAEESSLEICEKGVDKGIGLQKLCDYLQIPIEDTIVLGDADNDYPALKAAGLGVAMGNANERLKGIADVVAKDNNHDGCAQIIEEYLL